MRIIFPEIETPEERAGKCHRKFVGNNPTIDIKHQVKHIDFLLIELGIYKSVVFRPYVGRHVGAVTKLSVHLKKRLDARMRVRELEGVLLFTEPAPGYKQEKPSDGTASNDICPIAADNPDNFLLSPPYISPGRQFL